MIFLDNNLVSLNLFFYFHDLSDSCAGRGKSSETYGRYLLLIFTRHNLVKMRRSVLLIQRAARKWISQREGIAIYVAHHH